MWSVGSETVHVFLGRSRLGLQRRGGPVQWKTGGLAVALWSDACAELRPGRRCSVRVWLSGSLARPFILPAVAGLSKFADAKVVAAARASEETGLDGPCRVSIDAWHPGAPAICVAVEEALLAEIEASEDTRRVRVTSIRPWWSAVLCDPAAGARTLSILTVDDGESLVALAGSGDRMEVASSYVPALDEAQRKALCQRMVLAAGTDVGAQRHADLQSHADSPPPPAGKTSRPFAPVWQPAL